VVQAEKDDISPESFEEYYEITDGIEGYEMIQSYSSPSEIIYIYDNGKYNILFCQNIKKYYDININTEGYEIIPVYIGDYEGIYVHMSKQNCEYLSYDNGSYVISISVASYNNEEPIGQNALINLAKSVQKVEN
jgi:hypothetical protein